MTFILCFSMKDVIELSATSTTIQEERTQSHAYLLPSMTNKMPMTSTHYLGFRFPNVHCLLLINRLLSIEQELLARIVRVSYYSLVLLVTSTNNHQITNYQSNQIKILICHRLLNFLIFLITQSPISISLLQSAF